MELHSRQKHHGILRVVPTPATCCLHRSTETSMSHNPTVRVPGRAIAKVEAVTVEAIQAKKNTRYDYLFIQSIIYDYIYRKILNQLLLYVSVCAYFS